MDANLVARELEMALLAKLLEGKVVNASSNWRMRAVVLLHLLRTYLGPQVNLRDLHDAATLSPMLTWAPYSTEIVIDGVRSLDGIRLDVRRWSPMAAGRVPFEARLQAHASRPRPPIAATTYQGGALGTRGVHFEVRNEGYGTPADIQVCGVQAPDWVEACHEGNTVFLAARPQQAGVYCGLVEVSTNANSLTFHVSTQSAEFVLPERDEVLLDELLPDHPDLERAASEALLEEYLTRLHFERLPGGLFIRRGLHTLQERTGEWWLTEAALISGSVPANGYPPQFSLYLDVDGCTDKYQPLQVTAEHGQLGGEFGELFDLLDVQVGQKLSLTPFQGGYKAALSPTEPWRTAVGHTYWLQGPREKVLAHPEVLEVLLRRCDDRNITVNLLLCGEGDLPADLVRQHRAGRLTIRWAAGALPYRLLVCGDDEAGYVPPFGPLQRPATIPAALWEASAPLRGQDYREQAWQRGRGGEGTSEGGLLDLDLSVAMARLSHALAPAPPPASPIPTTQKQRRQLLDDLPRRARQCGVDHRPVVAAPHLAALGLSAEQVNVGANGYRVTAGGYLVRRHQDVGRQRECAQYVGGLYGGVIHHSQLRKLVEAFTGQRVDPASFIVASLDAMGWAGYGYRRPRQGWEPLKRDLPSFAAETMLHFGGREAALDWLRRNVAANEEQLARALERAEAVLPGLRAQTAPRTLPDRTSPSPRPKEQRTARGAGSNAPVKAAPPSSAPPTRPNRLVLKFAPLTSLTGTLPDPRTAPGVAVRDAVVRLVEAEGPITESWLVRRYAQITKLNPAQVRRAVLDGADLAAQAGDLLKTAHPGGGTDFVAPDQLPLLRERGSRQPEDIPLGEWCALLKSLGLRSTECDEAKVFAEAAGAYRFGTAAGAARPMISLAWDIVRQDGARA